MSMRYVLLTALFMSVASTLATEAELPPWFLDSVTKTGTQYRKAITAAMAEVNAVNVLNGILKHETANSANARQAHILLARLKYPSVFTDYEKYIHERRKHFANSGGPWFISSMILRFTKHEPESKFVDEPVGRRTWEAEGSTTNKITFHDAVYKRIERYTDAEVANGTARNAAARQAVLEHFLKFIDEGDANEQSGMVDAVYRLWGSMSFERQNEEPIADDLIEAIYRDNSRPLLVRYTAGMNLPAARQQDIECFMLNIVTNNTNRSEYLVQGALSYLQSSANTNILSILKCQTNGPAWKNDRIEKAIRTIESNLLAHPMDR